MSRSAARQERPSASSWRRSPPRARWSVTGFA
jgi:hypothetical protein